ncbi:prenylcysteine oxidase 1 [Parasteatoda tepidariorum]|uniref:prenylcysteine oxidase 1 n=1 Tax=Parasteatoda tepidariorum TaxID=114398 RepID=UPI00077FC10D|nr:prenylcysteine oxidase 1 [Parasteatoda tepidariorum]
MIFRIIEFFFMLSCFTLTTVYGRSPPKIAIVGGGIGGTSCAHFLNELFGGKADITLYERDLIGGRLNLVDVDRNKYEAGGAVIHLRNEYMLKFADKLGLGIKKPESSIKFGVYDGEKFVIEESDWYIISVIKFLWRYGFSTIKLWKDVKWMLDEFSRIYDLQKANYSFTTVNGLLDSMNKNFKNMTQVSLAGHLGKHYSKAFLDELVQSVMMVNYGQTNNISAFAGFVSLAGADSNLWSIDGGNKRVPEGLLRLSKAKLVNGDVTEIILLKDGSYNLKYVEPSGSVSGVEYDIVIIANPLIKGLTNIKFTHFKKSFQQFETKFHRTVATFVKGFINPAAFNADKVPNEILTCQPHLLFNSIGKVTPVSTLEKNITTNVYKVFSAEPLTPKTIHRLFNDVEMIKERDWLAYPHYEPPENVPPFLLYPGLYYINAIELSASAMEMSAIGAKNVALLSYNLWNNLMNKVDHHSRIYKDEL